jgi:hypothetical protein
MNDNMIYFRVSKMYMSNKLPLERQMRKTQKRVGKEREDLYTRGIPIE